jgi:hypothetical protein
MCVEVVHHQANDTRLGIDRIDQPADRLSKIQPGALLGHLDTAASRQRFDKHKQVRRPQALLFTVRRLGMSWPDGQRLTDLPMHHQRHITQSRPAGRLDHRAERTDPARPPWQPQSRHRRWECTTVHVATASARFLSNWHTVSGEMRRTYPNSTAWPASIRTVQWSCPSGTLLQVSTMRWAACPSVSAWRRRSCRLSVSTASTPPARKRCRMLRIVCSEISSVSAISASVQQITRFSTARSPA